MFIAIMIAAGLVTGPVQAGEAFHPDGRAMVEKEYRKMLREERQEFNHGRSVEKIVSGIAALGIGVYGYYFDQRNTGRQLAYSATQTAGVFMISHSLLQAETPSLLLQMDQAMRNGTDLEYSDYKRILVMTERKRIHAGYKQAAYSSGILSALYAFNSYQERAGNVALHNIFAFLSVNFAVVSGASFYQMNKTKDVGVSQLSYGVLPTPFIALDF